MSLSSGTGHNLGPLDVCYPPCRSPPMAAMDMSGSQLGDMNAGDVAGGNIYNITASLEALVDLLQSNLDRIDRRVARLEELTLQQSHERQAITRALMLLANENTSVRALQRQLDEQIAAERQERANRRQHLDRLLYALFALNAAGIALRVIRRRSI